VDDFYARTLNELAEVCHGANERWWHDAAGKRLDRNKGELLMLIVSEIVEAMEGERKSLQDDKLPHRLMAEVELADALIRIFDYSHAHSYDIGGAFIEKMEYNRSREDHTHAARSKEHGKKF
jgi:NTP pyrophosphatase (non-canonical NTP hydrolase)